ncbi:MnmC family methyltransferase [Methanobrevibacter millerae]|uniref:tRNA U34 5-methylaminomethyl-2-thiouridine-forming methyltransferase MnmC n=1 Tax=Methanobrevibacter millerae TaxID=230361 RepID=A0A1G5WZ83_9EURY|nr:MnmC family methyltransferase [Methanobrevibacter millerae]SDA62837.1 tRNA U34 5-methylaminomethyl-2-thiouridine-forming methyltransferase MnmC [Methanobrevibacter millerae]
MDYEKNARVINDDIFDLINRCFDEERSSRNNESRLNFFDTYNNYFVLTDDGSYSINSKEINHKIETLHTSTGAISEAFEKFIKPMKFDYTKDITILDICAGLGYNSSAAIDDFLKHSEDSNLKIDMVEISAATLACGLLVPSPIKAHDITRKAIENELIKQDYATLELETAEIPSNIDINVYIEDARKTVQRLDDKSYDAIFLDPFSQNMAPELFSLEFFKQFRRIIKDTGIVATYTSAAPVRAGFIKADFYIGLGPIFGRKQGGTLASPSQEMLDTALPKNDEIRIALSDVGIPFRDPGLDNSSEYILDKRTEERHAKRHTEKISSAVKTPIFLAQEMDDEKLKRRVERNLAKMNIPSTTSAEAKYIVEIENTYSEKQDLEKNSRNRILDMAKKLKEVKNGDYS